MEVDEIWEIGSLENQLSLRRGGIAGNYHQLKEEPNGGGEFCRKKGEVGFQKKTVLDLN